MIAYWFSKEDGTSDYNTNPAEIGRTDTVEGEIIPCKNGLHASPTPRDALAYAGGPVMWEVELGDAMAVSHGDPIDKYASNTRKYLRKVDLTKVMRQFAAKQALSVRHLWEMPAIVVEYLELGASGIYCEDIRVAAQAAAWTAQATARDAAQTAAQAAAWAARDAAWTAARAAAQTAAWSAWAAAWSAWTAAWTAARDTARDTARDAAWTAARAAARNDAWAHFNTMALEALDSSPHYELLAK